MQRPDDTGLSGNVADSVSRPKVEMGEGNYTMISGAVNYEPSTLNNIAIVKGKVLKLVVKMKKVDG